MSAAYLIATAASSAAASITATASAGSAAGAAATPTIESIITSVVPSIVASALPSSVTTTAPLAAQAPLGLPVYFEVAAIFAGALSGGLLAVTRKFDITGVLVLALVNGLGGGIIRDLLLQDQGIFALEQPRALLIVLAATVIAAFFFSAAERLRPLLRVVDALSLGLFCIVGADKALVAGLTGISVVMLGTVTSTGGGVLRDILCDREPEVLRRGSLYSLAAIAGSGVFVVMVEWLHFAKPIAMFAAASIALLMRFGSLWLGWESPEPFDLTGAVVAVPRQAVSGTARAVRRFSRRDKDRDG